MTENRSGQPAPALPEVPTDLLIGGKWRPATSGRTFTVDNPATGDVLVEIADADAADAAEAIEAAAAAGAALAAMPTGDRAELLRAVEGELRARADEFALLITLEMGKNLDEALAEVSYAADFFGWFAAEATRIGGDYRASPTGATRVLVQRRGVGPCLLVTPWNFPLAMATRKIGPALAAGCPSVLKPAEQTPLTSLLLARVMTEAGVPAGALNVITTTRPADAVTAVIDSGLARKLSFTGSTAVGKVLLRQCAAQVMRTSMELGGNAPFVVFADADIDAAVDGAMAAKLRNMGQACTAANRFLVAEPVAERFTAELARRMGELVVGPGWEPATDIGPLIDDEAAAKFRWLTEDAVRRGAKVETGSARAQGRFVRPTVLSGVRPGSALLAEEIFGPLAPVMTFSDEDEAVALANDTPYGLVSYVYTRDLDRGLRMFDRLDSGMTGLNVGVVSNAAAPFGGIKHSGLGREGGVEGIDEYLDTKYAAIRA
ncbi:NAD-dependent succinate-semialdehyde dehydrogenase [Streptomyces sp. NBC_01239]|uniref:NAD-dependent succinate-semialdehyde dehydrogenase n=1 Tax=Streptomyces sp. NBC_01239 TaxID=2903792 RepID=UPI00224C8287|nr:NAD-dependent succinate-semialdehyde dehydrogenase [Streptomyces sp. NBC_01239]MCX4817983.1 NAD-dependent succinate-semialdehyde dehydrogenase [Streptomyces sp. NBC_01239]